MIEISFSGRGGQGMVLASRMSGLAFFKSGKYPQCYSGFGGERRGAPLSSFLRVDDCKIGSILINTRRPPEALHEMTPANHELNIEAARPAFDQVHTIEPGGAHV